MGTASIVNLLSIIITDLGQKSSRIFNANLPHLCEFALSIVPAYTYVAPKNRVAESLRSPGNIPSVRRGLFLIRAESVGDEWRTYIRMRRVMWGVGKGCFMARVRRWGA